MAIAPRNVSKTQQGWRVGYRFKGPEGEISIADEGDLVVEIGSSLYVGYEPRGFFQSTITVDGSFVDFKTHLGNGQVNGQSGVYLRFKPGMLLVVTVVVGIVLLDPLPDELTIPALLEGARGLFEGLAG